MSVTSGFFNSVDGDRQYNAEQMSELFDGLILDGVYANVGNRFQVSLNSGPNFSVYVGTGRAWLGHTWILNDAPLSLTFASPHNLLTRIDAIVFKADRTTSVREGTIEIVQGTPASNPVRPTFTDTTEIHYMPIAYVTIRAGASDLKAADIASVVGLSECPYVKSPVSSFDVQELYDRWQTEWEAWTAEQQVTFTTWFEGLQDILDDDVAANLTRRMLAAESSITTIQATLEIVHSLSGVLNSDENTVSTSFTNMAIAFIVREGGVDDFIVYLARSRANSAGKYIMNAAGAPITGVSAAVSNSVLTITRTTSIGEFAYIIFYA